MSNSYGIPGKQVDGMNVIEVYEETKRLLNRPESRDFQAFGNKDL